MFRTSEFLSFMDLQKMRMVTSGMFPSPVEYLCIFVQVCFVRTEIVLLYLAHIRLDRRVNQLLSEVRSASESQKEPLTRERLDISGVLGQNQIEVPCCKQNTCRFAKMIKQDCDG